MNSGVEAVRSFNRFYTRRIGVLREGLLSSPYSLTEARLLFELAHRDKPPASELGKDLGLDAGYLSRVLGSLENRGLLRKARSKEDGRQSLLSLTTKGRAAFAQLNGRSQDETAAMLGELPGPDRRSLIDAMGAIERILGGRRDERVSYILRPHQPGDMGWVIQRHGELYAREYGWDQTFEALVAQIAAKFVLEFDPRRERCWIAERQGERVGSAFLVKQSDYIAKLRLLLVTPEARGLGIGRRLVEECLRFAQQTGYRKIMLWTNDILTAARHIYEQAGFRLVEEDRHHSFGYDLVGQTWELELTPPA
jgi:DNA-binding MarR family transcriptional regulator/N-acetylglutamate synthase-like GNAT family acetyltransferase